MNIISAIKSRLGKPLRGTVFFVNPHSYLVLRKSNLICRADAVYFDGLLLCLLFRLLRLGNNVERKSFDNTSLAPEVFREAEVNGKKVALIGSAERFMAGFYDYMQAQYPQLNIVFHRHGYFRSASEKSEVFNTLKAVQAELVVVGMGAGRQEEFIAQLVDSGWSGDAFTCGGFIHQTAQNGHNYYPVWVNKLNLRFLYRAFDAPRIFCRHLVVYPGIVFCFLADYVRYIIRAE